MNVPTNSHTDYKVLSNTQTMIHLNCTLFTNTLNIKHLKYKCAHELTH